MLLINVNTILRKLYYLFGLKTIKGLCVQLKYRLLYLLDKEIRSTPEIISIIDGGLGSQMSQYSLGLEIARITGNPVSFDTTYYDFGTNNRPYELEKYFPNLTVPKASHRKIELYDRLFNKYDPSSPNIQQELDDIDLSKPPIYLNGYFKSKEKYSNYQLDNLQKMFTFNLQLDNKNQKMLDKINSCNYAVALQLRLGDYIGSILDIVTPQYFCNAIERLLKVTPPHSAARFFVFSNDIEKAKNWLSELPYEFTFVDFNDECNGVYDMYLMTQCHHFIISNSTFGFWPAMLSTRTDKKTVIQPNKHLKTDKDKIQPVYPGWICLDC